MTRALHRISAALFSVWFAVFTVAPGRVHSCPTHDSRAIASSGHDHSAHASHHMDAASGPTQDASGKSSTPDSGPHQCTCPGASCCSGIVAIAQSASVAVDSVAVTSVAAADTHEQPVGERSDYVLPFATAPPVVV